MTVFRYFTADQGVFSIRRTLDKYTPQHLSFVGSKMSSEPIFARMSTGMLYGVIPREGCNVGVLLYVTIAFRVRQTSVNLNRGGGGGGGACACTNARLRAWSVTRGYFNTTLRTQFGSQNIQEIRHIIKQNQE